MGAVVFSLWSTLGFFFLQFGKPWRVGKTPLRVRRGRGYRGLRPLCLMSSLDCLEG